MGVLIYQFPHYSFCRIDKNDINEAIRFVVETNYVHHQGFLPSAIDEEVTKITAEEKAFFSESFFFAARDNATQKIIGSIRICRWKPENQFSFPAELNANMKYYIQKVNCNLNHVWHMGRFAVNVKNTLRLNVLLFKMLIANVFSIICKSDDAIFFAEADKKLFEKIRLLNVFCEQIGDSEFKLGSEAVPIYNTAKGLQSFVEKHKHLCYV